MKTKKLIIEIDEDKYKWIKEHQGVTDFQTTQSLYKSIINAVLLESIISEIEEIHLIGYATVDGKREIASRAVMQIIDKYKAESEGKE